MAKKKQSKHALADPSRLDPHDSNREDEVQVVIETPKGSRNKYAFDPEKRIFTLKTVLPAGMAFPYDFGFVPSTLGGDGDPVDVLVLMDESAFPGCLTLCRLVGIIEGEQVTKGKKERNDRIIAVEKANHNYARVKEARDLSPRFLRELEDFFVNYHELSDSKFRVLDVKGPRAARRCVKNGMRALHKK